MSPLFFDVVPAPWSTPLGLRRPAVRTDPRARSWAPQHSPQPDPLCLRRARGVQFDPVEPGLFGLELLRALDRGARVPGRLQSGPTCGLYALGMVMDYWNGQSGENTTALVQSSDLFYAGSHTRVPTTSRRLLEAARRAGYTRLGEMFWADDLRALAHEFGYQAELHRSFALRELHACLDRGHPVLVGFDVDAVGHPGLFHGQRPHWAVIEGHFSSHGVEYLVAIHGWSGRDLIWRAEDLLASAGQLDRYDPEAADDASLWGIRIPPGGDLTRSMRNTLVEIFPSAP
jgi:hypothetical protein